MHEGRPHAGDMVANGQIQMMVITSTGDDALDQIDGLKLRRMALAYKVPIITTISGALANVDAIKSLKSNAIKMVALQDYFDTEITTGVGETLQSASASSSI
ncbi:hypothetical protein LWI28_028960 [Acer negundo]|uniref:MGS-like domain-containing protein n=1 Tax=Acer negundo TaxID=4023 RepID=A0AAD5P3G0_ACENE|nr:hypothetical protein LWI28_028960 [Acer negundo]